jgi:hypothetical protein
LAETPACGRGLCRVIRVGLLYGVMPKLARNARSSGWSRR